MKAMMAKLKSLFVAFLTIAASAQKLGINLIRVKKIQSERQSQKNKNK